MSVKRKMNRRQSTLIFLAAATLFLACVTVAGILLEDRALETDFPESIWLRA